MDGYGKVCVLSVVNCPSLACFVCLLRVIVDIYIPHVSINPFSCSADLLAPAIRHKLALSQRQYKLWAGERMGGEGRGGVLVWWDTHSFNVILVISFVKIITPQWKVLYTKPILVEWSVLK